MGSCVDCGGRLKQRRRYDFRSEAFRRVYDDRCVYVCERCGLYQADVSKIDESRLLAYYRHEYRSIAGIGVGEPGHRWFRTRAAALAELAAEHCVGRAARAFEVGAGYGHNLLALKQRYPDLSLFTDELDEGIELPEGIQRGRLSDGCYDIVILSHVLEHFSNPKSLIAEARDALSSTGIAIIEVPNDVPGRSLLAGTLRTYRSCPR